MSNLLRVFGGRDATARRAAIADTYADDVILSDPDGDVIGHEAIDAKVEVLLAGAPGFVFSAVEPIYESEGWAALAWVFGPAEGAPVARGVDVMTVRDGRITTLRTMLAPLTGPVYHHVLDRAILGDAMSTPSDPPGRWGNHGSSRSAGFRREDRAKSGNLTILIGGVGASAIALLCSLEATRTATPCNAGTSYRWWLFAATVSAAVGGLSIAFGFRKATHAVRMITIVILLLTVLIIAFLWSAPNDPACFSLTSI
jgi:hypothetical protein